MARKAEDDVVKRHGHTRGTRVVSAATAATLLSTTLVVVPGMSTASAQEQNASAPAAGSSQDPLVSWMENTATQLTTLLVDFAARVGAPQQVQDAIRRVIVDLLSLIHI